MNILSDNSDINSDYLLENEGKEKSDGIELLLRRKNKSINGWISYHFNKTNYSFNNINNGKFYKADHDFTHELKTVLITSILNWNLTASWSYSSGRSFTNEDYINITTDFKVDIVQGKKNTLRLPPSHHLDISISKDFNLKMAGMGGSDLPDLKQEFSNLPHDRGTLSMARSSDPNSANSQFFICFKPAPFLDNQYTVFGKVIEGIEFIDKIKRGDENNNGAVSDPDKIISFKSL